MAVRRVGEDKTADCCNNDNTAIKVRNGAKFPHIDTVREEQDPQVRNCVKLPRINIVDDEQDPQPCANSHKGKGDIHDGYFGKLSNFEDLPEFLRDNEYLLGDHRPKLNSYYECIKSSFRLHSETVNIWSHLAGCVLCLYFLSHYVARPSSDVSWEQKLSMTVYLLGYTASMGSSVLNHCLSCHSEQVSKFHSKLDYCCVIAALLTSYVPWLHAVFYCRRTVARTYMAIVLVLGALGVTVVVKDKFSLPKYRSLRAVVFICLGLTGVVPGIHYLLSEDMYHVWTFWPWLGLMGLCHMSGALIYWARVPERYIPGKCNVWGHSHQIMHFCSIGGALAGYHGAALLANFRLQQHCEDMLQ